MIIKPRCLSAIMLVMIVSLLVPCRGLHDRTDKIGALLTGRVDDRRLISSWFMYEPMISPLFVPSRSVPGGDAQIRKFVRIYFPRNYEAVQIQDFILFEGTQMAMFSPLQQRWMHDAVLEGTGGMNSRSLLSTQYFQDWADSATQRAFPNDVEALLSLGAIWSRYPRDARIILEEGTGLPPVLTMFKGKGVPWYLPGYRCALVIPRQGAVVWSWIEGPFADRANEKPGCTPQIISWQYGEGITWTTHDSLTEWWWQDPMANPYGFDIIMNMILYCTGRQLPADVEIIHDIRSKIIGFNTRTVLLLGTIEFAEGFGANMAPIFEGMDDVMNSKGEADEIYLAQEYEQARLAYSQCIEDLEGLNALAIERKDRALIWIYLAQWLIVSATLILAGFTLWLLMIRRRLYREVASTSFRGR